MEAVKKIVSADTLSPIIGLPWSSKEMLVEVVVRPLDRPADKPAVSSKRKSLKGCLKEYANPTLWAEEQHAWENHIAEKYGAA